jgi:cyclic dehypoxanthinyl futalosine synthase
MGLGIAQMALFAGADDAGSTMMEENVVSASGTEKTEANEAELQSIIIRAGFTPRKRDSEYNKLPTEIVVKDNIYSLIPAQIQ